MRQTQMNSLVRGSPQGISAQHARAEASPCREQAFGPGARARSMRIIRRRGFTVVELLVVIAIIIVLLSILIVAVNAATRTGQRTRTSSLMTNMTSALVRFREDLGYYPPVLGPLGGAPAPADNFRALLFPPDPEDTTGFEADLQDWWSVTSLAEYLIGYGTASEDGHAGPGLRNTGSDGVWGAAANTGALVDRLPPGEGKVYGSYLEIDEKRLLGSINGTVDATTGRLNVFFPGEGSYNADDPKVIVDYWGNPLRYYRQVYREGVLTQPWRDATGAIAQPTLAEVYLLRPWELKVGTDTDAVSPDADGDTTASFSLKTAEFVIFSPGQDRRQDQTRRRDPEEFNADNIIVEGGS